MATTADLFTPSYPGAYVHAPLAERMRPRTLNDVVGQTHLLGPGKPLRVAFQSGRPHSMIFWGPPGVGKTTLARLMADGFDAQFIAMSAVLGGVKDIREAVTTAQIAQGQGRRTILFVDEVHRFNKAQQDAFLPYVESGLFTFIGATTENPSFEVNSALLSRARVYVLNSLSIDELKQLIDRAVAILNVDVQSEQVTEGGSGAQSSNLTSTVQLAPKVGVEHGGQVEVKRQPDPPGEAGGSGRAATAEQTAKTDQAEQAVTVGQTDTAGPAGTAEQTEAAGENTVQDDGDTSTLRFDEAARDQLARWADGDARRVINAMEVVVESALAAGITLIDSAWLETSLSQNLRRFDKGGDAFYDQISAMHKAVRGSDPDASLYWFSRMLDGGADPRYLSRRIVRMAIEDVGLADPRATQLALQGADIYERLGSPEGELALAQAVVYMACAAKSNAVYMAYKQARRYAEEHGSAPVPMHLRNAPTKLMKELGHGQAYRYAHDEPHGYAAGENYFPDGLRPRFYQPTDRGLEGKISEKLAFLRSLDKQSRS